MTSVSGGHHAKISVRARRRRHRHGRDARRRHHLFRRSPPSTSPPAWKTQGFSTDTALAVFCSNVSGQTASVRILILHRSGGVSLNVTRTLDHGEAHTFATQNIVSIGEESFGTGSILGGTLNVESTQSGVFCTAYLMDTETLGPNGMALHLIRVNPHPGTVE